MELIHPILGTRRTWPEPLTAAKPRAAAPISALPVLTQARVSDHSLGLIYSPVTPERAKQVLMGALYGDLQAQYDLFCTMEDNWDRLTKCLNEVKNAVKRLTWNVTPYTEGENQPTSTAQAKADLVQRALKNWQPEIGTLEYSFEDALYHALDAMGKGLSVQEVHWGMQDGAWLPRAAHYVTPRAYGWDAEGTRLGLVSATTQARGAATWRPFSSNQFLVGQWHVRTGFAGATALLRPLVPYWIGMTYGWRWLMQTAQIFGIPFRWATYDPSQPQLEAKVAEMLENLGSAGWAAFPAGTTLDFKEAVTNARANPQALIIEMAKKACDLAILGQELSSESEAAGLGSGNAVLQGKVRQDVLHNAAYWVADLVNYQLVSAALRLNFGDATEAPVIAPDLSIDPDPKLLAERDQILLSATDVQFPKKDFYQRHGIRMPEAGEEVVQGKAPPDPFGLGGGQGPGTEPNEPGARGEEPEAKGEEKTEVAAKEFFAAALEAKAHDAVADKLVDNVLEELGPVEARWLGGVKPYFRKLIDAALDEKLTDAQFIRVLDRAQKEMPELFGKLDVKALQDALEAAMGAACVNGAVQGWVRRRPARR